MHTALTGKSNPGEFQVRRLCAANTRVDRRLKRQGRNQQEELVRFHLLVRFVSAAICQAHSYQLYVAKC